jgi:hypothetical protein
MKKKILRLTISQPFKFESSETKREAPLNLTFFSKSKRKGNAFCFKTYLNNFQPEHIKSTNIHFLEWFIGFCEGDGSFIISNTRCYFIINQKDFKVLYKIKKFLGFGQVLMYTQKNQLYGRYVVQDKKNCERLAHIFNGNLVLEKTTLRLKFWLKKGLNINPLNTKGSVQLNNAWLSGFIDAEGCFSTRLRKDLKYKCNFRVERKFIINQKSELVFFKGLKRLFKSNSKIQKTFKKNSVYYKLEFQSMQTNQILLNYLKKFPCKGEKNLTVMRYERINNYMQRKEHLTKKGLDKIRRLCKKQTIYIKH